MENAPQLDCEEAWRLGSSCEQSCFSSSLLFSAAPPTLLSPEWGRALAGDGSGPEPVPGIPTAWAAGSGTGSRPLEEGEVRAVSCEEGRPAGGGHLHVQGHWGRRRSNWGVWERLVKSLQCPARELPAVPGRQGCPCRNLGRVTCSAWHHCLSSTLLREHIITPLLGFMPCDCPLTTWVMSEGPCPASSQSPSLAFESRPWWSLIHLLTHPVSTDTPPVELWALC